MEIRGSFAELVAHAQALREEDGSEPLQLFVLDVPVVTAGTPAILCSEGADAGPWPAADERYRYVLMLHQVQQVHRRWQACHGQPPNLAQACRAVMHFSETDRHLLDTRQPAGEAFVWPVRHRRGDV